MLEVSWRERDPDHLWWGVVLFEQMGGWASQGRRALFLIGLRVCCELKR
jgi:hypothetical protein